MPERTYLPGNQVTACPAGDRSHDRWDADARRAGPQFPGHIFRRTSGIDEHHSFARYQWELLAPDGTAHAGLDVAEIGDDGLIRRVVGFLGPIPPKEG